MNCTKQFWNFFQPVAQSVDGIGSVMQSGADKMDRLLANSGSSDFAYPATFLLRPKYSLEDNGAGASIAWFDSTFYVICQGRMDDEADEDTAFDQAEELATAIATKIRESEAVLIDPMAKVFMEPVTLITLEASFGYEVRYRVGLFVNSAIYENI